MFTKLLKHELKAQGKILGVLSLSAIGAGLIGCLMLFLLRNMPHNSPTIQLQAVISTFSGTILFGAILGIIAYSIGVWILQIARFYQRHFTDQGYLTFTLPATTHQILLSGIVNFVIWTTLSGIVTILSFILLFLPLQDELSIDWNIIWEFNNIFSILYGVDSPVLQIFSSLASSLYQLILPLLAITMGAQMAKKHKLLVAFAIYYGLNMGVSIVTSVSSIYLLLSEYFMDGSITLLLSTVMNSVLYLGLAIGGYFLMYHLIDKKLNLP